MRVFILSFFVVFCHQWTMAQATNVSCQTAMEVVFNETQEVVLDGAPSYGSSVEIGVYFHFEGNGQVIRISSMQSPRNAWFNVKQSYSPCEQLSGFYDYTLNQPYEECVFISGHCSEKTVVFQTVPGKHYYFILTSFALASGNASYTATLEEPVVGCLNPTACNYNAEANLYQSCEWSTCMPLQEGETVMSIHLFNPAPLDANGFSFCPTNFELTNSDSTFFWIQADPHYLSYYNESTGHYDMENTMDEPGIFYSFDRCIVITRVLPRGCYTLHFTAPCSFNSILRIRNGQSEILYSINVLTQNSNFVCFDAIPGCTNPEAMNFNELATYEDGTCAIFADVNGDQIVDINDLQLMIDALGCEGCDQTDINDNGIVDVNDIMLLIEYIE